MSKVKNEDAVRVPGQRDFPERLLAVMTECPWTASVDGGRFLWLHPAAGRVFRRPVEELMSDEDARLQLIHEDDRAEVVRRWRQLQTVAQVEYDYRLAGPYRTDRLDSRNRRTGSQ